MAVLTEDQLKAIFHSLTVTITGLNADRGVRNTYPPQGQPAWKITEDVVFVTIQPVSDPYDKLSDVTYGPAEVVSGEEPVADFSTSYTRVMAVDWIVYGPNAMELADRIRFKILQSEALATLKTNGIAPITDIDPARLAPDLFNGQWWKRYDLRALFNVLTTRTESVPYLEGANIEIHTEQGLQETIIIEE
jgi:hypothetical protein